jgi:hypothetical protein
MGAEETKVRVRTSPTAVIVLTFVRATKPSAPALRNALLAGRLTGCGFAQIISTAQTRDQVGANPQSQRVDRHE